jgi:hypothetical protein
MDSFFNRALPYIEMGWQVFPTRPDKRPLCPHGRNDATTVALTIEDWSDKFPDANVSIKTGEASGICVIDIDSEEGELWISSINRSWNKLPDTAVALSGRGRHLYYTYPRLLPLKSADGKLAPGVDIKAAGGSITAPVSLHASGKLYQWVTPPFGRHLPIIPMWIVMALAKQAPKLGRRSDYEGKPPSDEHIKRLLDSVASAPEGQRNHTLNKISFIFGLMVKDGHMVDNQAFNYLLGASAAAGLDQHESTATIRSGLRSGMRTVKR